MVDTVQTVVVQWRDEQTDETTEMDKWDRIDSDWSVQVRQYRMQTFCTPEPICHTADTCCCSVLAVKSRYSESGAGTVDTPRRKPGVDLFYITRLLAESVPHVLNCTTLLPSLSLSKTP